MDSSRPSRTTAAELDRVTHQALRLAVARLRECERRRIFPPIVHVGRPGGGDADFVDLPYYALDHALRTEVVAALLSRAQSRAPRPMTWLTRSGDLGTEDVDLAWYAATRSAYGEATVPVAMAVVTRHGWYDPRTGSGREWRRLRLRGRLG